MTDTGVVAGEDKNSIDSDAEEAGEELTLDQRQDELKKSRWNVFLWLGIAVLMFTFALFPMPFSADYDDFTDSAEKDIGLVWGPSLSGDDLFDVPLHLDVTAVNPPKYSNTSINAYVIKMNNCQQNLGIFTEEAKTGGNHAYQYQSMGDLIEGEEYTFKFSVDPGQYCIIVQYFNETSGEVDSTFNNDMMVKGKVWPNQVIGGLFGLICLSLSAFAFIGAQKHGAHVKKLLETGDESTEQKVLASLTDARVAAGPTGPPSPGPTGPPQAQPTAVTEQPVAELVPVAPSAPPAEATFEPAEGGYFYKKLPDGSYEQTVYVQNADGTYAPYQA